MKLVLAVLFSCLGLFLACQTASTASPRVALLEDSGLEEVTILAKGLE